SRFQPIHFLKPRLNAVSSPCIHPPGRATRSKKGPFKPSIERGGRSLRIPEFQIRQKGPVVQSLTTAARHPVSQSAARPYVSMLAAKTSGFWADCSRSGSFAHPFTHGHAHHFFCFSATFWEAKATSRWLEAKRRAVPRRGPAGAAAVNPRPGTLKFLRASKAIIHYRPNEMAGINSIESAPALG